ncbi:DNA polymerase III subunit delta [Candidatus Omnitrophota bacterium]
MVKLKQSSVYLLAGTEQFLKQESLAQIKSACLDKESSDFNFNVFYAGSDSLEKILSCAQTKPFLGKKRLVLVYQIEQFSAADKKLILPYLKTDLSQTVLVLETGQNYLNQGFFAELTQGAQVIFCRPLEGPAALASWIKRYLAPEDKEIAEDALTLLLGHLGGNLQSLAAALENLILYTGGRRKIERADVEVLVGIDLSANAFELFEAVLGGDRDRCFEILDSLLKKGVNSAQIIGAFAHKLITQRNSPFFNEYLLDLQRTDSEIKGGRQTQRLGLELMLTRLTNRRLSV